MVTEPFSPQPAPSPTPPACSKCGSPTRLARIEPTTETDYDLRTYECRACGNSDIVKVKFR
jgi:DNA-directed RNA polymerase subunit RPC12/RpoP